jgi:hypothetical protein
LKSKEVQGISPALTTSINDLINSHSNPESIKYSVFVFPASSNDTIFTTNLGNSNDLILVPINLVADGV